MKHLIVIQWSDLIEMWNDRNRAQRHRLVTECAEVGHEWAVTPLSDAHETVRMCTRCCEYLSEGRGE